MNNAEELKKIVKDKYSEIALQSKEQNEASCCGVTGCCTVDYAIFADNYTNLEGYNADADLGLGCGVPTEFSQIKKGNCEVIGDACATKDLAINGQTAKSEEVQKSFLAALNYFYSTVKTAKQYLEEKSATETSV